MGTPLSKDTPLTKFTWSFNQFSRDISQIVEKCPILQCWIKVKVQVYHTHIERKGPELIPDSRQSACRWQHAYSWTRWWAATTSHKAHSDTHAYHKPGGRLPLLSARPAVTFPAVRHHRPWASTKLYCLVTEAHRCEKLAQSFYAVVPGRDSNLRPLDRESDTLPQHHDATLQCWIILFKIPGSGSQSALLTKFHQFFLLHK